MRRFIIALLLMVTTLVFSSVFFTDDGLAIERIITLLIGAEREVVLVSYSLDEPSVISTLNRLHDRGIDLQVIIDDSTVSRSMGAHPSFEILTDSSAALIHSKFIVIDRKTVVFGTGNFTCGSLGEDSNSFLVFESEEIADIFLDFYRAIKAGEARPPVKYSNMEFFLCPSEEARERVIRELLGGRKEIKVAMFAFTDSKILAALKFKSANGVKVSGVVDAWNSASQLERFLDSGLEVSWSENATVHDKTFIIDAKTVVTGSANATLSGWGKNREIIAIIYSGELSREFIQHIEFRRSRDDN